MAAARSPPLSDPANNQFFLCIDMHNRKSWLFAGSDRGADRAAFMATLITSAMLNDVDPQAWLADVLARIADTPITSLEQLLPWNWRPKKYRQDQPA